MRRIQRGVRAVLVGVIGDIAGRLGITIAVGDVVVRLGSHSVVVAPRDPRDPCDVVEELEEELVDVEDAADGDTEPAAPPRRDAPTAVAPSEEPPD
jgi:hypothetical protein